MVTEISQQGAATVLHKDRAKKVSPFKRGEELGSAPTIRGQEIASWSYIA